MDDKSIKEIENDMKENNYSAVIEKMKKRLHDLENIPLNVAVTGGSGAGKSTFINAVRDLENEDEGAAETGEMETTMEPTAYPHPKYKNVIYWDLPGMGTPKFSAAEYERKVDFKKYDFFIIISCKRFTENDILLAKKVRAMGKKFYFVRSQIDSDLDNSKKSKPKSFNERVILNNIRDYCVQNLTDYGFQNQPIFLISSFEKKLFDFSKLLEMFNEDLPDHKRAAFQKALPNISSTLKMKKEGFKESIPVISLISAAASLIPAASMIADVGILVHHIKGYIESFGVDEKSLKDLASASGKSVYSLKCLMKCLFVKDGVSLSLVGNELIKYKGTAYMTVKTIFSSIPLLGAFVTAPMSANAVSSFLYRVLDEVVEDAEKAQEVAREVACGE